MPAPHAEPPGLLLQQDPVASLVVLTASGELLVVMEASDDIGLMRARLDRVQAALRVPSGHVVLIGGGDLLQRALEDWRPSRPGVRLLLHHLGETGRWWHAQPAPRVMRPLLAQLVAESQRPGAGEPLSDDEIQRVRARHESIATAEQSLLQRPVRLTYGLLGLLAVVFVIELVTSGLGSGGQPTSWAVWRLGALSGDAVRDGEWWRLLAATALHGGFLHILVNGWGIWSIGPLLERLLGPGRFAVLYVLSGLGGSLASASFNSATSVGASGALFGLMGALFAAGLSQRSPLPPAMRERVRRVVWQPILVNIVFSFTPGIDLSAHLGGLATGMLLVGTGAITYGLPQPGRPSAGPLPGQAAWRLAGMAAVAALLASVVMAIAMGRPWEVVAAPPVEPVRVAEGEVALRLPRSLADARRFDNGAEVFGRVPADPALVAVQARRVDEEEAERWLAAATDEPGAGPVRRADTSTLPNGVEVNVFQTLRDGWLVTVETALLPHAPDAWRRALQPAQVLRR